MAFIGMDPTVVRDVGQRLKAQAGEVGSVIASVDKLINRALGEWDGHDAHQFHGWWTSQHRPVLRDVQQKLDGLGQSALNNATEQEHVSDGHGSASSGAGSTSSGIGGSPTVGGGAAAGAALGGLAAGYTALGQGSNVAKFLSLLRHRGSLRSIPWNKVNVRGTWGLLKNGSHATAELRPLAKFLGPLGIGVESANLVYDVATGASGAEQIKDVAQLGVTGLAYAVPEVGLPIAAAQTGWFIGTEISKIPAVHHQLDNWSDGAYQQALSDAGGDATAIGDRYDGISGFGHFAEDTGKAAWNKLTGLFG